MKMIYIASMHNAGSTVIALVGNAHPEVISPGELVGPGGRFHGQEGPTCSCGVVVSGCPFWQDVATRYRARGYPWSPANWGLEYQFDGHPVLNKLAFSRLGHEGRRDSILESLPVVGTKLRELHERNRAYAETVLEVSGRNVILDASKHPERLLHLSRVAGLELYVVHLLRDPRGWCNSRKKTYSEPVEETAPRWVSRNQYIERIAEEFPAARHIRLLYEDFCRDPQTAMNRITSLAGLPDAPVPDDLRTISHHLLGNRMRNRRDATVRHDVSWQKDLSAEDIRTVERLTDSCARRYGYEF